MAKISACIISYNEEKKIEDCLKSLAGVVDEIILVDSLSTDQTVKIASKYAAQIYDQKFLGHIEQKNLAVDKAKNDWILSLDCDERLSDDLRTSICAIKEELGKDDAYKMARKTYYIYRWLNHCWYPDMKVRLFNKHHAHWGGTNPHDKVMLDSGKVVRLEGDILHYSFDSLSSHIQTLDTFSEIAANEMITEGKKVSVFSPFTHGFWIFFRMYFLKKGFLDGFAGLLASVMSFVHVFVKYSKVLVFRWKERG